MVVGCADEGECEGIPVSGISFELDMSESRWHKIRSLKASVKLCTMNLLLRHSLLVFGCCLLEAHVIAPGPVMVSIFRLE